MMLSAAIPLLLSAFASAQYTATYTPSDAPATTEQNQAGTNACGGGSSQESICQNVYINSVEDFCLWAPPYTNGTNSTIGETERIEVAWCMKDGYGTRLIPDDTIIGAHFVQTPDYVQVTGYGNFTNMNIPAGDEGGELDPHGADGNGNPIGGLVFGSSYGTLQQYHEWTNYMAVDQFCIRACVDGPNAPNLCNHIYDLLGCDWNMPGNYSVGIFEDCLGDTAQPMGIYTTDGTTSTFQQGQAATPSAHPIPSSSSCTQFSTISNGEAVVAPTATPSVTGSSSGAVAKTSSTGSKMATSSAKAGSTSSASGSKASGSTAATASSAANRVVVLGSWERLVAVGGVMAIGLLGGALVVL